MPPDVANTCHSLDECADAYANDGWWVRVIAGKFGSEYFVHFDITNEELPYPVEKLKIHLDWSNSRRKTKPYPVYK